MCLLFFKKCLFFYQIIALHKLWKTFFISSKKLFSFLRYSNFCISTSPSFSPFHLQIYGSQCMTSLIIPLSFVLLNLESVERRRKKYKNLNISRTKRAFSMKWKTFFTAFEGLSFGWKNKNVIKNSRHKL